MTINTDGRRRLTILANYIEHMDEKYINMDTWFDGDTKVIGETGAIREDFETIDCHTAACAAGWACSIPELNKEGLYLKIKPSGVWSSGAAIPHYGDISNWNALEKFFDLTMEQGERLFDTEWYGEEYKFEEVYDDDDGQLLKWPVTGKMVADNIRSVLAEDAETTST